MKKPSCVEEMIAREQRRFACQVLLRSVQWTASTTAKKMKKTGSDEKHGRPRVWEVPAILHAPTCCRETKRTGQRAAPPLSSRARLPPHHMKIIHTNPPIEIARRRARRRAHATGVRRSATWRFTSTIEPGSRAASPRQCRAGGKFRIGLNYRQHARETKCTGYRSSRGLHENAPGAVQHPRKTSRLRWLRSAKVDYECELAVKRSRMQERATRTR